MFLDGVLVCLWCLPWAPYSAAILVTVPCCAEVISFGQSQMLRLGKVCCAWGRKAELRFTRPWYITEPRQGLSRCFQNSVRCWVVTDNTLWRRALPRAATVKLIRVCVPSSACLGSNGCCSVPGTDPGICGTPLLSLSSAVSRVDLLRILSENCCPQGCSYFIDILSVVLLILRGFSQICVFFLQLLNFTIFHLSSLTLHFSFWMFFGNVIN